MARKPVRSISDPGAIIPAAAPVNTYVQPASPAPSSLHGVAEGLAHFDAGLRGFLEKRREKQNEADRIRGEAAFNRNNQVGWSEAVKQGLVPANASPIFMESYKKAQGNLAGIRLREKFNQEYVSWEGRNSDDPAAFDQFIQTFVSDNIQTDDIHVLESLNTHVRQLASDAYNTHGREVAESTYRGAIDAGAAIAGETIDYASQDGLVTGEGTDYQSLWGELLAQREEQLGAGIRAEDFDNQLVKAIAAKAIEHQDPELLELLDETLPGSEVKLSSLPANRDIKQNTIEAIENDVRQRMNENYRRQKKLDEEAENKIRLGVSRTLSEDPSGEIPEDIIRELEKYDPTARVTIAKMRKNLQDADGLESREDLLMVEQMIQDGATSRDIQDLVKDGIIRSPSTFKNALDRVEKRREALREGQGVLTTQTSKRYLKTIKQRTEELLSGGIVPDGLTDEGLEATRDFETMLIEWETLNPNATLMERERAANEIGSLILGRIDMDTQQYTSEADATELERQDNILQAEDARRASRQEAVASQEEQQSQASPEEPSNSFWSLPSKEDFKKSMQIDAGIRVPRERDVARRAAWENAEHQKHFSGDQPPKFEDLDPVVQDKFKAEAETLGMDVEEYKMKFWENFNKKVHEATEPKDNIQPNDPRAETIEGNVVKSSLQIEEEDTLTNGSDGPEELREEIAATIETALETSKSTKQSNPLLDLIGKGEGTDKGRGYNETLAYGKLTGGDVDLVNMTLNEIDELQGEMLAHKDNKWKSSALGRYQIVRKTLRGLRKNLGLDGTEKFTPELQDRLATELLNGRGLKKWQQGKITTAQFQNNIAKEWASLPTSSGGSHYGQRVGVSSADMQLAFKGALGGSEGQEAIKLALNTPVDQRLGDIEAAIAETQASGKHVDSTMIASKFLGYHEKKPAQAKTLGAFIRKAAGIRINPATTAWCAGFANAVLGAQGYEGTGKLNARSFLKWGRKVRTPSKGDVVVFWRESPSSWKGHVGFYDKVVEKNGKKYVRVLGGNQKNAVNYSLYPADRVLGYRRPKATGVQVASLNSAT